MKLQTIKQAIEKCLDENKEIALFPLGVIGLQTKLVMKEIYDIEPVYIFDNHICKYNKKVLSFSESENLDLKNVIIIYTLEKSSYWYNTLLNQLEKSGINYINLESETIHCQVGKHSYGDLIYNNYADCGWNIIESIGAFSSFAEGTRVVPNHPYQYITTSPFIFCDKNVNPCFLKSYEELKTCEWYIDGIVPRAVIPKNTKSKIGNDVWLGHNVTITNGANIGNGVIAGAGAVITKDVPDYAIVAGVPAKIIRYRYSPEQIEALNRICWWDWSDEEIRDRYDDFFLPIDEFISKYDII